MRADISSIFAVSAVNALTGGCFATANCYTGKSGRHINVLQPGLIFADVQQMQATSLSNE